MLRNPTTNRGEVEATPVPVVLNSESFLLGSSSLTSSAGVYPPIHLRG